MRACMVEGKQLEQFGKSRDVQNVNFSISSNFSCISHLLPYMCICRSDWCLQVSQALMLNEEPLLFKQGILSHHKSLSQYPFPDVQWHPLVYITFERVQNKNMRKHKKLRKI